MPNTTQLVLVRHAETTMTERNRIHGHSDAPISKSGMRAIKKTAKHFRGQRFDALYSSSLGRALTTAKHIGKAVGLKPIPLDGLRERGYGWLEGKLLPYFEPDLTGPVWLRPIVRLALLASGESEQKFIKRVITTTEGILSGHQHQRVMMVIHWGLLSMLSKYLTEKSTHGWHEIGPWTACGITEFHAYGRGWHTIRINNAAHL